MRALIAEIGILVIYAAMFIVIIPTMKLLAAAVAFWKMLRRDRFVLAFLLGVCIWLCAVFAAIIGVVTDVRRSNIIQASELGKVVWRR